MSEFQFSLDKYLQRIGMAAATISPPQADLVTLSAIMAAQSESIAFENIDVVIGRQISMSKSDVVTKLVGSNRGGYCFEQNTLLSMALEDIGFGVMPLACRVRWGKDPDDGPDGPTTTYTHLALKVTLDDGSSYLADVGFAGVNSIAPVRLGMSWRGVEQDLPEGRFRIVEGTSPLPGYSMLQLLVKEEWKSIYAWQDVRAPLVDLLCYNWYSCTYPTARFTTSFFVCRVVNGNERHHILNGEYIIRTGHGMDKEQTSTAIADRDALLELLRGVFNIQLGVDDIEGPLGPIDRYLPSKRVKISSATATTSATTTKTTAVAAPPSSVDNNNDITDTHCRRQKQSLRKYIRSRMRLVYPPSCEQARSALMDQSKLVFDRLFVLPQYQRAKSVGIFLSMPHGEIQTEHAISDMIFKDGKTVYVPRVGLDFGNCNMEMVWCADATSQNDGGMFYTCWPRNKWGIPEPPTTMTQVAKPGDFDLLVVPGCAFDVVGHRLGQGKGYYDRYIQRNRKDDLNDDRLPWKRPLLVGVCLEEQFLDKVPDGVDLGQVDGGSCGIIPVSVHDYDMDIVLAPSRTLLLRNFKSD